jgi:hypothetical protein
MRHIKAAISLGLIFLIAGCTTVNVAQLKVMAPRQEINGLRINVDKHSFNEEGEAVALENGLKRKFNLHGYRVGEKGHELQARIINISRGSKIANSILGLGVGKDVVEIEVKILNTENMPLISFNVVGEVLDKRYAEVREMLSDTLPEQVVQRVKSWGYAKN